MKEVQNQTNANSFAHCTFHSISVQKEKEERVDVGRSPGLILPNGLLTWE